MSTSVFGNDLSMDVKDDFNNLIGIGKSIYEIEDYILTYKPNDDDDDSCAFWSALALIEWEYGVLTENTKSKTIKIINTNDDSHLYINQKDRKLRKEILNDLIDKLNSSNSMVKKPKNPFVFHSQWKQGDIFALLVKNHYIYFHVSGIDIFKHKIKELQEDNVYVKVFSYISEELLDFNSLMKKIDECDNRYISLNSGKWGDEYIEMIWCNSAREKKKFEELTILIGNLPVREKISSSVSIYFQYKAIEKTMIKLFKI